MVDWSSPIAINFNYIVILKSFLDSETARRHFDILVKLPHPPQKMGTSQYPFNY